MTTAEVLSELESMGKDSVKRVLLNHGIREPLFGVKIEDLKKIQKRVKKDHALALELFDSGIYDAMYLAGLIADDARMTKKDLQRWVKKANSPALLQYTVAWVAAESPHGRELALGWIDSPNEWIATAGWATLAGLASLRDDADLDLGEYRRLLQRVEKSIHEQPNLVRYVMNGFVIAVGSYIADLTEAALKTAAAIGPVTVDMGDTACKVPDAAAYIRKVVARNAVGKKRKTVKC